MLELPPGIPRDVPGVWQSHRDWLATRGVQVPRVTVHGGYGKNNLGDDAILHVLLSRVLAELPRAEITVVCHGPQNVARRYSDVPKLQACYFKSAQALAAIAQSHIYIIGGGGIINRINSYSGRETLPLLDMKGKFLFLAALGAKLSGAQTHFYAIGANSFPDAGVRFLARKVLATADWVSVRDRGSLQTLRELGLTRPLVSVLDPALSLEPAPAADGARLLARWGCLPSGRPLVALGFRYVRARDTDNAQKVRTVARLVSHLREARNADVVFLPASQHPSQHYEDDLHFGRAVLRALPHRDHFHLVEEYPHPAVMMAAFGCADLCIFERLHAVILATVMGVPVQAVAYDAKVSEYTGLIGKSSDCMSSAELMAARDYGWLDRIWTGIACRRSPGGDRPAAQEATK